MSDDDSFNTSIPRNKYGFPIRDADTRSRFLRDLTIGAGVAGFGIMTVMAIKHMARRARIKKVEHAFEAKKALKR